MSKKLAAKASLIQMPGVPVVARAERPEGVESRVKTAPGSMAHFMASQSSAVREAEDLRERLKAFDGARPVKLLDPRSVRPSRWANRHEAAYADAAFTELKAEIASAGGNVQPVNVREVRAGDQRVAAVVLNRSTPDQAPTYELIFGHRRHRACLELGLPVQAVVSEVNDQELFEAMERENRSRKNLSAWEQGMMYRRALDEGLYPSQRKLSEALGVDVSLVSKSLSLARLPAAVVNAFASPLEIQFRWAQPLAEALQRDADGVIERALHIRESDLALPAPKVLAMLLGPSQAQVLNRSTPPEQVIEGAGGRKAHLSRDAQGQFLIRFAPGALNESAEAEIAAFVRTLLTRP